MNYIWRHQSPHRVQARWYACHILYAQGFSSHNYIARMRWLGIGTQGCMVWLSCHDILYVPQTLSSLPHPTLAHLPAPRMCLGESALVMITIRGCHNTKGLSCRCLAIG